MSFSLYGNCTWLQRIMGHVVMAAKVKQSLAHVEWSYRTIIMTTILHNNYKEWTISTAEVLKLFSLISGFEGNRCQWIVWSILQVESSTCWSQSNEKTFRLLQWPIQEKIINICRIQSYRLRTRTVPKTVDPEFNETLTFYGITDNDILTQSLHILILGKYCWYSTVICLVW